MAEPVAGSYRNIAVAYDGSPGARAALARAVHIATTDGAALTLVGATTGEARRMATIPAARAEVRDRTDIEHTLREAIAGIDPVLAANPWAIDGEAASGVLKIAEEIRADLIVTGSRKHGRIARTLLGSVSSAIAQKARCDVLVVHPPAER